MVAITPELAERLGLHDAIVSRDGKVHISHELYIELFNQERVYSDE